MWVLLLYFVLKKILTLLKTTTKNILPWERNVIFFAFKVALMHKSNKFSLYFQELIHTPWYLYENWLTLLDRQNYSIFSISICTPLILIIRVLLTLSDLLHRPMGAYSKIGYFKSTDRDTEINYGQNIWICLFYFVLNFQIIQSSRSKYQFDQV